jgi:hypothetical protein
MKDRNLARGLFLVAISLAFGLTSRNYSIGDFARAGPGLFPAVVSALLFLIGIATVIRSFFVERVPMDVHVKNIAIILGSLCSFALVSLFVNMIAGIVVMVFLSTLAGTSYSWKRNLKISAGLVAMALVFSKGLGLSLPLY